MVNVMKGGGRAPPPSPAQANFTLMTECTPNRRLYYSVYSVVLKIRNMESTSRRTQKGIKWKKIKERRQKKDYS
jgi:hypothetical protein